MRKRIDPFLYGLPEIDIHGSDRFSAVVEIKNFINYCFKIEAKKFLIIHGKGSGVLKETTHYVLKNDSKIDKYYINNFNDGETIVEFKEGLWDK